MQINKNAILGALVVAILGFIAATIQHGGIQFSSNLTWVGLIIVGLVSVITPHINDLFDHGDWRPAIGGLAVLIGNYLVTALQTTPTAPPPGLSYITIVVAALVAVLTPWIHEATVKT